MVQEIRAELEKIHQRVNDVKDRVTVLETQTPYVKDALQRIERGMDKINGHLTKAIWAVVILFIGAVFKFTINGGWTAVEKIVQ